MKKTLTFLFSLLFYITNAQDFTERDHYFSVNVNNTFSNITVNSGPSKNNAVAQQSDGKIIVATNTPTNPATRYLRRLNYDGTLDNSFNLYPSNGMNVEKILIQPDDKILIGTSYDSSYSNNGTLRDYLRRLNSDGSIDQTFSNNLNYITGSANPRSIALQSDGKILVAGNFTTVEGYNISGIIRLNSDGLRDTSFSGIGNGTIIPLDNGKILALSGGKVVRLNSDGTLDTTFDSGIFKYTSSDTYGNTQTFIASPYIVAQPNGKILAGGRFNSFDDDNTKKYLIRLNEDGTLDTTFSPNSQLNKEVRDIQILSDGKILVAFDNKLLKLNTNGTTDTSFNIGTNGFNHQVYSIYQQSDNKILITGSFWTYQGLPAKNIVRLLGNSVLSTNNVEKNKIVVYPNPTTDILNIKFENDIQSKYEIFDLVGKKVLSGEVLNNSINVSSLSKGVYILSLKDENNTIVKQKFIKE